MLTGNYPGHAKALNANLLFMLSLGSLEAFHSNLFAMFAERFSPISGAGYSNGDSIPSGSVQNRLHRVVFLEVMKLLGLNVRGPLLSRSGKSPKTNDLADEAHFYLVKREWNHMDIAFFQYTGEWDKKTQTIKLKKENLLGVVEMKTKAIPDPYQLLRYNKKIDAKSKAPRAIVHLRPSLSSMPWNSVYLGTLYKQPIINLLNKTHIPGDYKQIVAQYRTLLAILDHVAIDLDKDLSSNTTFSDLHIISQQLRACRMNQVAQKTAYGFIGNLITEKIALRLQKRSWLAPVIFMGGKKNDFEKDEVRFLHQQHGRLDAHTYVDLSHGTGMCGFAWQYKTGAQTRRIGIQIQGTDLKLYVSLAGSSLARVSSPTVTGQSIETEFVWNNIVPASTHAGSSHPQSALHRLQPVTSIALASPVQTSLDFANLQVKLRSLPISLKTSSPREVNKAQALFHGYSSSRDDFSDLRFDIDPSATIQQITTFAADYLEWLLYPSTTACNGSSPFSLSCQSPSDLGALRSSEWGDSSGEPSGDSHAGENINGEDDQDQGPLNPYRGETGSVWERITKKIDSPAIPVVVDLQ